MRMVDTEVSVEEWLALHNRGICARIKGPTADEMMSFINFLAANPEIEQKLRARLSAAIPAYILEGLEPTA